MAQNGVSPKGPMSIKYSFQRISGASQWLAASELMATTLINHPFTYMVKSLFKTTGILLGLTFTLMTTITQLDVCKNTFPSQIQ